MVGANQQVDARKIKMTPSELFNIERVVYNEARGEDKIGRDAVRAVIYNRIAHGGEFGKTWEEVLNKDHAFEGVFDAGRHYSKLPPPPKEYLQEHFDFLKAGKDPTNGATFFLNPKDAKNRFNSGQPGLRIKNHVFYDNYNGTKYEVPPYAVALSRQSNPNPTQGGVRTPYAPPKKPPSVLDQTKEAFGKATEYVGEVVSELVPDEIEEVFKPDAPQATAAPKNKVAGRPKLAEGGLLTKSNEEDNSMAKNGTGLASPEIDFEDAVEKNGVPIPDTKAPPGALPEEVADDIPAMLSDGELVIPADVVRWHGLKHFEAMREEAKCGLMCMQEDGRLHEVDDEGVPIEDEYEEDEEGEDEGDDESGEDGLPFDLPEDWDSFEFGDGNVLVLFKTPRE